MTGTCAVVEVNAGKAVEIRVENNDPVKEQARNQNLVLMEENLVASGALTDQFSADKLQGIVFPDFSHTDGAVMVVGGIQAVSVSADITGSAPFITDRIEYFSFPADQRNSRASPDVGRRSDDAVRQIDVLGVVDFAQERGIGKNAVFKTEGVDSFAAGSCVCSCVNFFLHTVSISQYSQRNKPCAQMKGNPSGFPRFLFTRFFRGFKFHFTDAEVRADCAVILLCDQLIALVIVPAFNVRLV